MLGDNSTSFLVCVAVYVFAWMYVCILVALRYWFEREANKRRLELEETQTLLGDSASFRGDRQVFDESGSFSSMGFNELNDSTGLTGEGSNGSVENVSWLDRSRLLSISQNLVLALTLRIVWLVLTILDVDPSIRTDEESCKRLHTIVSAINLLSQLLFFTSYLSVVSFVASILKQRKLTLPLDHTSRAAERELSMAMSHSTTRNRIGALTFGHSNALASNTRENNFYQSAMDSQQGFNSIFKLVSLSCTPDAVQVLLNFWAYVAILILLGIQWFQCDPKRYDRLDNSEKIVIALAYMALSVMFASYGYKLLKVLGLLKHPQSKSIRSKFLLLTLACTVLLMIRGVLFILRPMFGLSITGTSEKIFYPWFFYPIPEIIPGVLLVSFMSPRVRGENYEHRYEQENSFIFQPIEDFHDDDTDTQYSGRSARFGSFDTTSSRLESRDNSLDRSIWM